MKVLLIGHSRIARRRVLPALRSAKIFAITGVASRTARRADVAPDLELFDDYEVAIARSGADLAYVSVANGDHARWAERCLRAGLHVVVDKPACLTPGEAQALVELAASRRRCLAEAIVFPFHPQVGAFLDSFAATGDPPLRATAAFSFPPLPADDFRHRRELGGGAINDLGPYVAAASRILFGGPPRSVACAIVNRNPDGVETAFSVLLAYDAHRSLAGHFGFDTAYQNRLLAFGRDVAVEMKRIFTLPSNEAGRLAVTRDGAERAVEVAPSDMFGEFLLAVAGAIEAGNWDTFSAALLADAQLVGQLRQSSGER